MTTRVIGVIDKDGIVRVSCGADTIEIQVVMPVVSSSETSSSSSSSSTPTGVSPLQTPYARMLWELAVDPTHIPYTWVNEVSDQHGSIDAAGLVDRAVTQKNDPARQDPAGIFLYVPSLNVHDIANLGRQIAEKLPGLPVVTKFRG